MQDMIEENMQEYKKFSAQVRNDIVGVKSNHTKLTKRVEDIERKWEHKFGKDGQGGAEANKVAELNANQVKIFGLAVLFLFTYFFNEIKSAAIFMKDLYLSSKEWAFTTFHFLSIVVGIVLQISFFLAILVVIYMVLSYIPIMKARMERIRAKVNFIVDKVAQDVPIIKVIANKIRGVENSDKQQEARRKAL